MIHTCCKDATERLDHDPTSEMWMMTVLDVIENYVDIQITFCPFCGVELSVANMFCTEEIK